MTRIPLHNLFERFLKTEKMDNIKDVSALVLALKYDKEIKDKFDKFLEQLSSDAKNGKLNPPG